MRLFFTDNPAVVHHFKVKNLKNEIQFFFSDLKKKKPKDLDEAEKFLASTDSFKDAIAAFCEAIDKVCSTFTEKIKTYSERTIEIKKMQQFGKANGIFIILLFIFFENATEIGPK